MVSRFLNAYDISNSFNVIQEETETICRETDLDKEYEFPNNFLTLFCEVGSKLNRLISYIRYNISASENIPIPILFF